MTKKTYTFKIVEKGKTFASVKGNSIFELFNNIEVKEYCNDEFSDILGYDFYRLLGYALKDYILQANDSRYYAKPDVITVLALHYSEEENSNYLVDFVNDYNLDEFEKTPLEHIFETDAELGIKIFEQLAKKEKRYVFTIEENN